LTAFSPLLALAHDSKLESSSSIVNPREDTDMADAKRPVSIAVMKGWLFKNHHAALKGSDKRWFELHGTELRYYEKETSSVPNRIINVVGAKWQDGTKSATKITFTLSTPVRPTQH